MGCSLATVYDLVGMSKLIAEQEYKVPIVALPILVYVRRSDLLDDHYNCIGAFQKPRIHLDD